MTEGNAFYATQWRALLKRLETQDPEVHLPALVAEAFSVSRSEARRVLAQGGVFLDDEPVDALDVPLSRLQKAHKLRLGTRLEITLA